MPDKRTAEQERARYWRRRQRGQCTRCSADAAPGKSMCTPHLLLDASRRKGRTKVARG